MLDYSAYIKSRKSFLKLKDDKQKGRLAHTFLVEAKDGDLAFAYAKMMAKIIIGESEISNNKIDKDIHPDVKVFGVQKKFTADDASEIVSDVLVLPFEGESKVYIIANAEAMNEESQNKLLKTLEEPPHSSYFIMAARTEKTLLQTVISRSKKVLVEEPTESEIEALLGWAGHKGEGAKVASICSAGDASKALKMVESNSFVKLYDNVLEMFRTMNSSRDILRFIQKFSGRDFVIGDFLTIVESIAMDLVYIISHADKLLLNRHRLSELKVIASGFSPSALSKILKECFDFRESLYYNVNMTPALDGFLLKFVEVKVKCKK
ncbi:MAG: hypothetical protein IJW24_02485 [Clostridia bacterium]|nr:hypothetical protein [Clostridia bacterium]